MSVSASGAQPLYIDQLRDLERFCESLQQETVLAVDTEFIPEHTYEPLLSIVQLATRDGRIALIDYAAIGRVQRDPLAPILASHSVRKIFHAAYGDLQVLQQLVGEVPQPIWDTQLVTRLFGYNGRTGYGAIVETLLGFRVVSSETLTDWSKRPLSAKQLHYAAEDVRFLIPLYELERNKLEQLGRLAWAEEECQRLVMDVAEAAQARSNESTLYQSVRGSHNLDRRSLAILRELSTWRDREARQRNRPRGAILKDDILIQITRRSPSHARQLGELRALNPRDLERFGNDILRAVDQGKRVPEDQCPPASVHGPTLTEDESALAYLLSAVLQSLAFKHKVSPSLIATTNDLQRLVYAHLHGETMDSPVLTGWRGELVRTELLDVLNGRSRVGWDAAGRALSIERQVLQQSP